MTTKQALSVNQFQRQIRAFYRANGRDFPWRKTQNPYKILVSEIMLQQTQTERVVKKYNEWLKVFPTIKALAEATLQDVLKMWLGLGYNRRALNLKRAAEKINTDHSGKFPKEYEKILELPGVGPYTAGAIMAFAFNKPIPIIETNIRTVFIHFFFNKRKGIHDKDILELVKLTLDRKKPREWYWALMDYGAMLKKSTGNLNIRSKHYTKQSTFNGSRRQARAAVLSAVTAGMKSPAEIQKTLSKAKIRTTKEEIGNLLSELSREGFLKHKSGIITIA